MKPNGLNFKLKFHMLFTSKLLLMDTICIFEGACNTQSEFNNNEFTVTIPEKHLLLFRSCIAD